MAVLKLKPGGKSRRDQEQELLNNNKTIIDNFLADPNSDQHIKETILAIADNTREVLAADSAYNRKARQAKNDIYQRMVDIINGGQGYDPANLDIARTNYFGRYDSDDISAIGNQIVRKTVSGGEESDSPASDLVSTPNPEQYHFIWDWKGGNNFGLMNNYSQKEKIKAVLEGLQRNIESLQNAKSNNKIIRGIDISKYDQLIASRPEIINLLRDLPNLSDDEATKRFIELINKNGNQFNINEGEFEEIFTAPNTPESKQPIIFRDQNLTDYLTNRGYKISKTDDGKFILTDSQDKFAADFAETDPSSPYYQWGFFINPETGEIIGAGNLNNQEFTSKFASQWAALAPKVRSEYMAKFPIVDYTSQGGLKGIDFSSYIPGSDIRFISTDNFDYSNPATPVWLPFQEWFEDWNDIKNQFNYKGLADLTGSGENTANQYARSEGFDPDLNLSGVANKYSQQNLVDQIESLHPKFSKAISKGQENENPINNLLDFLTDYICSKDPRNSTKEEHITNLHQYSGTAESHETYGTQVEALRQRLMRDPDVMKQLLALAIRNARTIDDRRSLITAYKSFVKRISSNKNGGVLFMENGGEAWADDLWKQYEQPNVQQNSVNSNKTSDDVDKVKQFEKEEGFKWKIEDTLRGISLLSDIGAIASSNIVGWGTLGAGLLGLASTGLDYAADLKDKTVTPTQRNMNLGMGLGATALGLIPDAKILTTGAKSVKWLRNIFKTAGAASYLVGLGAIAYEDANRIKEVLTKPENEFTGDDLRLIFNTVRAITMGVMSKKMRNKNKAISDAVSKDNARLFPTTNKNGEPIKVELSKDQFDQVVKAGQEKGTEEANKLFRQFAGEQVGENSKFPVNFGENWFGRHARKIGRGAGRVFGYPTDNSYVSYQRPMRTDQTVEGIDRPLATWGTWEGWNIRLPKWLRYFGTSSPEIKPKKLNNTETSTATPEQKIPEILTPKAVGPAIAQLREKYPNIRMDKLNSYLKGLNSDQARLNKLLEYQSNPELLVKDRALYGFKEGGRLQRLKSYINNK